MKIKVLIVEDEPIVAMMYKMGLEKKDFKVSGIFPSGEEAVKAVEEDQPDFIIMDIKLSGIIDGIEAAEIIRKIIKIPLIYVSGNNDAITRSRAMETEPVNFLVKPVDMKLLCNIINETIN